MIKVVTIPITAKFLTLINYGEDCGEMGIRYAKTGRKSAI